MVANTSPLQWKGNRSGHKPSTPKLPPKKSAKEDARVRAIAREFVSHVEQIQVLKHTFATRDDAIAGMINYVERFCVDRKVRDRGIRNSLARQAAELARVQRRVRIYAKGKCTFVVCSREYFERLQKLDRVHEENQSSPIKKHKFTSNFPTQKEAVA